MPSYNIMMNSKNYITPTGYQKLVDELQQLAKVERPEILKVIQWAASLGDRSENADYLYVKKRLREIDLRSRFLSKRIDAAVVIDPKTQKSEKIVFGATVTVINEDEVEFIYSIVGEDEINPSRGLISWKSPIGKSLLGKEEGDTIFVKSPSGKQEFEIVSITFQKISFNQP